MKKLRYEEVSNLLKSIALRWENGIWILVVSLSKIVYSSALQFSPSLPQLFSFFLGVGWDEWQCTGNRKMEGILEIIKHFWDLEIWDNFPQSLQRNKSKALDIMWHNLHFCVRILQKVRNIQFYKTTDETTWIQTLPNLER